MSALMKLRIDPTLAKCHYSDCRNFLIVVLNVIMLGVVMVNVYAECHRDFVNCDTDSFLDALASLPPHFPLFQWF
jgi:hypothetical protein